MQAHALVHLPWHYIIAISRYFALAWGEWSNAQHDANGKEEKCGAQPAARKHHQQGSAGEQPI